MRNCVFYAVCSLVEKGGDWDRRNRLKVYEGIHLLSIREFKQGAQLMLDGLATFTSTEIMEYKDFVKYVVLASAYSLPRSDIKKKVFFTHVLHNIGSNGGVDSGIPGNSGSDSPNPSFGRFHSFIVLLSLQSILCCIR